MQGFAAGWCCLYAAARIGAGLVCSSDLSEKEFVMRGMALAVLTVSALALGAQTEARADMEYPYCLEPSAFTVGTCSFDTFEQCMASASGNVGVCVKNPRYVAPAVVPVQPLPMQQTPAQQGRQKRKPASPPA
jgi:hypothetical protein